MADMKHLGLVKKNLASRWANPPLILPTAGPEKFRFTLDLRYPKCQAEQVLANAEHGRRVGVSGRVKVLRLTGSNARILRVL
jgi:hypothetical protein